METTKEDVTDREMCVHLDKEKERDIEYGFPIFYKIAWDWVPETISTLEKKKVPWHILWGCWNHDTQYSWENEVIDYSAFIFP